MKPIHLAGRGGGGGGVCMGHMTRHNEGAEGRAVVSRLQMNGKCVTILPFSVVCVP